MYYYNKKHQRIGSVFQDRFKSEGIKDNRQLLEAIRYIHNNPVRAKIVEQAANYPWSSYNLYIGKEKADMEFAKMYSDFKNILGIFLFEKRNAK